MLENRRSGPSIVVDFYSKITRADTMISGLKGTGLLSSSPRRLHYAAVSVLGIEFRSLGVVVTCVVSMRDAWPFRAPQPDRISLLLCNGRPPARDDGLRDDRAPNSLTYVSPVLVIRKDSRFIRDVRLELLGPMAENVHVWPEEQS